MIDLAKALSGDEADSAKIALLGSHGIVDEVLVANPKLRCSKVIQRCVEELGRWDGQRGPAEPVVIGWLHLFAELRQLHSAEIGNAYRKCTCLDLVGQTPEPDGYLRLLTSLLHLAQGDPEKAVFLNVPVNLAPSGCSKQLEFWDRVLSGPRPEEERQQKKPPARTGVGQVLVMHLLEYALSFYSQNRAVKSRALLNLLIVPLVRAVYSQPDRAHLAYARYWYGYPIDKPRNSFHTLYGLDLGLLEDFQSRGSARRSDVLATLRTHLDSPDASDASKLERKINHVLHGIDESGLDENQATQSPKPKMTRVSQMTCLIREIDPTGRSAEETLREKGVTRKYSAGLAGVQYRQANRIGGESPGKFDWSLVPQEKKRDFQKCVETRYEYGHDAKFLDALFKPRGGDRAKLPVWIQDGEVTFLWLLAALKSSQGVWREGEEREVFLSKRDIAGPQLQEKDNVEAFLSLGSSLTQFAISRACLFDQGEGHGPSPKGWALWTFLQRAVVSGRPAEYGGQIGPLSKLVSLMYAAFHDEGLSLNGLKAACKAVVESPEFALLHGVVGIEEAARLSTFLLEVILRDGDPTPYSLFFYPISFEKLQVGPDDLVVPTAFLAGTFGGLEWDCFPSVTDRQNYHLFSVLDAIRPLVDHELGVVLGRDQSKYLQEKVNGAIASDRARTVAAVTPAAEMLAELFRQARSHIAVIEAAVNPDWGGLFGTEMGPAVSALFESGVPLEVAGNYEPDLASVEREHAPKKRADGNHKPAYWTRLGQQMVFLARSFGRYEDPEQLWAAGRLSSKAIAPLKAKGLFRDQPFLCALTQHAILKPPGVDPLDLVLLLKSLAVDTSDSDRGISILQLAAALGRAGSVKGSCALPKAIFRGGFDPKQFNGVTELAGLIAGVSPTVQAGEVLEVSTNDLSGRAKLPTRVLPFQLLRALSVLTKSVLTTDRPGWMALRGWRLAWRPAPASEGNLFGVIELELTCSNWFSSKTKEMLWEYGTAEGEAYHDLRTSVGVLWRAVQSGPNFVRVKDVDAMNEATLAADDRFVIAELSDGPVAAPGRCSIWRLTLGGLTAPE